MSEAVVLESSMTKKGQVTIPVAIRRKLGLAEHDRVAFTEVDGEVRLSPAKSVVARTAGMLAGPVPMSSPAEEERAVEEAWAAEAEENPPA